MKVLVVAYEPRDAGELAPLVKSALPAATVDVAAIAKASESVDNVEGYGRKVFVAPTSSPSAIYSVLRSIAESEAYDLVVGEGYRNVRDALSRLAGSMDLPMATDVTEMSVENGEVVVVRGFLSERARMKMAMRLPAIVLYVLRPSKPGERIYGESEIIEVDVPEPSERVVERRQKSVGTVNLEEAEIIVGVGRGFRSKEDLGMAFELAELLGGQVGCTRPIAADLKWLGEDHWIGISGKRVSPKLYIAIGISGSPQHMSGVQGAKVIVAINKDKSAPIFRQADYGVVADLYKFVPILIDRLKKRIGK